MIAASSPTPSTWRPRGSGAGSSGSGTALHSFEKRFRWARSMDLLYVRGHV